jgi:hypothetical protein
MGADRLQSAGARRISRAAATAAFIAAAAALCAQGAAAPRGPEAASAIDFRYDIGADGQPVFTQVLRWEEDANALEYLIVIKDEAGTELVDARTAEAKKEVQLSPGSYTYKIVTYNLLGKPEEETEWLELRILRAEKPLIASASPKVIYMDSLDGRVTIQGDKLIAGARVFLKGDGVAGGSFEGREAQRKGDEEIVVTFPDGAYQPGNYGIAVENPGGLSSGLDDALRIRYQRPVDILVSAGYSPLLSLNDGWFTSNWPAVYKPLCFDASLGVFFIKQKWGFIGIEGQAQYRRLVGGESAATITSDYLLAGANLLYKYRLTRRLHGVARVGGGLAYSEHSFDYDGFPGPSTKSRDPFARVGASAQYFTPIKLYAELGADWSCIFLKGHLAGGVTPSFRIGYQLF